MAELKANMVEVQDDDEFQQLLSTFPNRPVVLRLGAPWCQHCKKMEQPFKEIGASFKEALFVSANVDKMETYGKDLRYTPTFSFYYNSRKVDEIIGVNAQRLRDHVWLHCDS
mmetsp:Transcript_11056/g.40491  ORF Transcript_11056/g.40491 Transcript_11056/m.40491 type:complete len:112 (-) Transcript_11056:1287-1622(-)